MRSKELKVSAASDYYLYTPSTLAKEIYFYPICTGYFYYEPDYYIKRNSYDSFLIMHIIKGECSGMANNQPFHATKNQFVLLNCYTPHEYGSTSCWEASWLHFDGPLAKTYYDLITNNYGNVLSSNNAHSIYQSLTTITNYFRESKPIRESLISTHITNILTELLNTPSVSPDVPVNSTIIEDTITYINEHFNEPINLDLLAAKATLSPFYFTRVFTTETGFTPHQYLIATRINAAKFLLKSSETSIKDIAFSCGFNSESGFCSTFKKWEQLTPSQYRDNILA